MRIDETHKPWLYITIAAIALSGVIFVPYSRAVTPGGGTAVGLTFGVIALSLMVFAALPQRAQTFSHLAHRAHPHLA